MKHPARVPAWRRYLRFWGSSVQSDIDAELRFHFDARTAELVSQGVDPAIAHRRAREEFGDVMQVSEALRDIDGRIARRHARLEWLGGVRDDLVYGARSLLRSPAVTVTIILTLALGLGVNAAMFSFLNQVFGRYPAGIARPESIRRLWISRQFGNRDGRVFYPGYDHIAYRAITEAVGDRARTAIYSVPQQTKLARGEDPPKAAVVYAGAGYFEMLGAKPAAGRVFLPEENRLGANVPVAVVSDAFRRRMLDPNVPAVGQRITVGSPRTNAAPLPYTVVGVMRPEFTGLDLDVTDIWLPLGSFSLDYVRGPWWNNPNVNGFAILLQPTRPGVDRQIEDRATLAYRTYQKNLGWGPPDSMAVARLGSVIAARGPGEERQEVRVATRLAGVAAIVLLIACANVINLLLARAVQRRREIAVRLALGISRARLIRLLVTESVLLAVVAGAAAVIAAQWGGSILRSLLLPDVHWATAALNLQVILFAIAASIVAGLVAGTIPAWQSSRPDLADALKAGAREGVVRKSKLRSTLVVVQAALSVMLLAGAALFVKSLNNVHGLDIGFASDRLVFASITFDTRDSARDATIKPAMDQLTARLRRIGGVESVALTSMQPMWGFAWDDWFTDKVFPKGKQPEVTFAAVSPEYFTTTGIRILRGTGFPDVHGAAMPRVTVINEAMAQAVWPGEDPLGRCIRFGRSNAPCYTVTGVVENARRNQVIEEATAQYYVPLDNPPSGNYLNPTVIVRADPRRMAAVSNEARAAFRQTWPAGIPRIVRMNEQLEPQYRPWRLGATLFAAFGLLALLVAAIGIYSTVSYGVTQRTHEFGVRMALGARVADVVRLVIGEGLRTVAVGVVIGVAMAIAAGRLIASLLYGIQPTNAIVLGGVAVALLVVAATAALAPAWKAARVDPANALRVD